MSRCFFFLFYLFPIESPSHIFMFIVWHKPETFQSRRKIISVENLLSHINSLNKLWLKKANQKRALLHSFANLEDIGFLIIFIIFFGDFINIFHNLNCIFDFSKKNKKHNSFVNVDKAPQCWFGLHCIVLYLFFSD